MQEGALSELRLQGVEAANAEQPGVERRRRDHGGCSRGLAPAIAHQRKPPREAEHLLGVADQLSEPPTPHLPRIGQLSSRAVRRFRESRGGLSWGGAHDALRAPLAFPAGWAPATS